MNFYKLLHYDFRRGFLERVGVMLGLCLLFWLIVQEAYESLCVTGGVYTQVGCFDLLYTILRGIPPFVLDKSESFIFPADWMLFSVTVLFWGMSYAQGDVKKLGKHLIVKSGRMKYRISKWICNLGQVFFGYLLLVVVIILYSLYKKIPVHIGINVKDVMQITQEFGVIENQTYWEIMLLNLFVIYTFSQIQMMVSLMKGSVCGVVVTISLLMLSAYYTNPYFLGSYTMGLKVQTFLLEGHPLTEVWIGNGIVLLLVLSADMCYWRKCDVV